MKLQRHYNLVLAAIILITGSIGLFGDLRIMPYSVSTEIHAQDVEDLSTTLSTWEWEGEEKEITFFDEMFHDIDLEIDPDDYDSMILTYTETGEKDYFSAVITIDGITIENVGIRVKGNSSLMSATGVRGGQNENYDIPFLIKFNEFVEDQNYMGYTQLALRAQFNDPTAMQEMLSYEIIEAMGINAPSSVYATISLNGEKENLYIVAEVITDEYLVEHMDDDEDLGDLFKVSGGGHGGGPFGYSSDDPTDYGNYELKTNENDSDLYDLIELFKFIDESSDEEFIENIEDYLDIDAFIEYIAFCNVLLNLDSVAGNGNNWYIYQDPDTEQFLVIPWDLNESFGRFGADGDTSMFDIYFENTGTTTDVETVEMMIEKSEELVPLDYTPIETDTTLTRVSLSRHLGTDEGHGAPQEGQKGQFQPPVDEDGNPLPPPNGFVPGGQGQGAGGQGPGGQEQGGGPKGGQTNMANSTLIQRIFEIDEFNQKYLESIESLLNNEFDEDDILDRISEIEELLLEKNEEYNFWDEGEIEEFHLGLEEMGEYVIDRIEYTWDALKDL
jgi:spore coat protein CotH